MISLILFLIMLMQVSLAVDTVDREERISAEEVIFTKNGSLFNMNSFNTIRLLDGVQGFLFDNNRGIIFYKRNGTVYSSTNHQPVITTRNTTCHIILVIISIVLVIISICVKFK